MSDPKSRLRALLTPPPGREVGAAIGRFLTAERDPRVVLAQQRREAEGEGPSMRAVEPSPMDRLLASLPERAEQGIRRATRPLQQGPAGAAMRALDSVNPADLLGDVAVGPVARVARSAAPRVGSTFTGAGTMEAALEPGVRKVFSAEVDPRNVAHYNRAFGKATEPVDVMKLNPDEIARMDLDLLHSSPVCTQFSCANKNAGEIADDIRAAQSVVRLIQRGQPRAVSIENVPRYRESESFQEVILPALKREGYNIDQGVYNAADLGGIQDRSRFIARGVREGELPQLPEAQPRRDWFAGIEDLLSGTTRDRVPDWEMNRLRAMADRGTISFDEPIITMGGSAGRSVAHARNAGGPAPTLKAANEVPRIILPDGDVSRVSPEIMRRLMGLPDDYPLPQNFYEAKRILGQGMEGNTTRALIDPLLRR